MQPFSPQPTRLLWLSQLNGPLTQQYPLEIIESELRRSRKNEMLLLYSSLETLYFESWVQLLRFGKLLNIILWNLQYLDYLGTKALELETGAATNEPVSYAIRSTIEHAVLQMVYEGVNKGLWKIKGIEGVR